MEWKFCGMVGMEVRLNEDGVKVKMKSARTSEVGAISVPVLVYRIQFCCISMQIIVKSFRRPSLLEQASSKTWSKEGAA